MTTKLDPIDSGGVVGPAVPPILDQKDDLAWLDEDDLAWLDDLEPAPVPPRLQAELEDE
jgi:hypothetical protein